MFEQVKLWNFKSFDEITLDLRLTAESPKHIIIIYGPNGGGKSSLLSSFRMLGERIHTLSNEKLMEEILASLPNSGETEKLAGLHHCEEMLEVTNHQKNYKSLNSENNMRAEYYFLLGGRHGIYTLEDNGGKVVYERLDFELVKSRGICFELTRDRILLNGKAFTDEMIKDEISNLVEQHWGKHSLLAILYEFCSHISKRDYELGFSSPLRDVLHFFNTFSYQFFSPSEEIREAEGLLPVELSGSLPAKNEKLLAISEEILSLFLPSVNNAIQSAHFRREKKNGIVNYELMLTENQNGKTVEIPQEMESLGTRNSIAVINAFQRLSLGQVVILDEFESNLHENVISSILEAAAPFINTGQLICTTHMTKLMECRIDRNCFYTIGMQDGKKVIKCIMDNKQRTFITNNVRDKYFVDTYGGLPGIIQFDFSEYKRYIGKRRS